MGHRIPVYVVVPGGVGVMPLASKRVTIFVHSDYEIDVVLRTVRNKYPDFKTFRWKNITVINNETDGKKNADM